MLIHGALYFTAVTDIVNNYNRYLASTTNKYCKLVLMAVVLNNIHLYSIEVNKCQVLSWAYIHTCSCTYACRLLIMRYLAGRCLLYACSLFNELLILDN